MSRLLFLHTETILLVWATIVHKDGKVRNYKLEIVAKIEKSKLQRQFKYCYNVARAQKIRKAEK